MVAVFKHTSIKLQICTAGQSFLLYFNRFHRGLGPVRRTFKRHKGTSRPMSYLIKVIKTVHRSYMLDITTYNSKTVAYFPFGLLNYTGHQKWVSVFVILEQIIISRSDNFRIFRNSIRFLVNSLRKT